MYIPTTFMASQGSCFRVTTSTISGSGLITSGSFISGGVFWDWYRFATADYTDPTYQSFTASLNILSGSTGQAKLLIVGAGGAGGSGANIIGQPASDFAAGGGGGGGVVYYNNFPISSGSYEIAVGGATTQINSFSTGSNGRNSYVKLPKNITYTPFTSSFLTAYGGGGGGYGNLDSVFPIGCVSFYGAAGPTTGGNGIYTGQCSGRTAQNTIYTTLNGLSQGPQGFKGGDIANTQPDFSSYAASGGGGAGGVGLSLAKNDMAFGLYASDGGPGLNFNLTGTTIGVSPGGGGQAGGDTGKIGTCVNSGSAYGRGGQGERDGNTSQINFGFGGVVILAIPKCYTQATQCRTYIARAGASNSATLTYIPCGVNSIVSGTLAPGASASVCTYVLSPYPTITGTGAQLTASVSCSTDIELPATCPSGTQLTNLHYYQYSNTTTGSGGSRAYGNATYYNAAGQLVVAENFAYENPTEYFCAKEVPQPYISSGSGILLDLGVGGCGDYCTSSYAPPPPFPPFPYNCSCYQFTAGGDGPGPEPGFVGGLDCITGQYVGFSGNVTFPASGRYCWRTGTPTGSGTFSLSGPLSTCTGGAC